MNGPLKLSMIEMSGMKKIIIKNDTPTYLDVSQHYDSSNGRFPILCLSGSVNHSFLQSSRSDRMPVTAF
jgi:hypothetical protein